MATGGPQELLESELGMDAPILGQVEGHWHKLMALVVWKLAKDGVTITAEDMTTFPEGYSLLTHGKLDGITLKVVSPEQAATIREYNQTQKGSA